MGPPRCFLYRSRPIGRPTKGPSTNIHTSPKQNIAKLLSGKSRHIRACGFEAPCFLSSAVPSLPFLVTRPNSSNGTIKKEICQLEDIKIQSTFRSLLFFRNSRCLYLSHEPSTYIHQRRTASFPSNRRGCGGDEHWWSPPAPFPKKLAELFSYVRLEPQIAPKVPHCWRFGPTGPWRFLLSSK